MTMRWKGSTAVLLVTMTAACSRPPAADKSATASPQHDTMHASASDSSFASLQKRGEMAMGVDQYTSSHKFEVTSNGGRISLQRDANDSVGLSQIRAHMRLIQHAFQAGDFSTPSFVHEREMPGTDVMTAKRAAISYEYEDLPRGGAVVIMTNDPEARAAIARFLQAQRTDHRAH
jgi:hypothetical protein